MIAAHFKISGKLVVDLQMMGMAPGSLDAPVGDDEGRTLANVVADETTTGPREGAEASDRRLYVQRLLGKLKPQDRELLESYFGFNGPQASLGDIAVQGSKEVTREAVRQRLKGVLQRILKMIPKGDMEYLQEAFSIGSVDLETKKLEARRLKESKLKSPMVDLDSESDDASEDMSAA